MKYTPRSYHGSIIDHIIARPRCNVWSGMGTGKTGATLTAVQFLALVMGEDVKVLILAPLRVARSTWPDEARKWDHLRDLRVALITGDRGEREAALREDAHVYTMNYENLPWLADHLEATGQPWPFTMVVADEATRLKSFRVRQGGRRAGALGKVAHKQVRRFVNLTGTPAPNGLVDLWGQCWFVDAGQRLGRSFSAFDNRWFATKKRHPNDQFGEKFAMPHAQEQIEAALRDVTITVRAQDFMDLPPLIENTIEVDLPPSAARHYRELEREMFTQLAGGEEVEAFNAAAMTVKCLQCANGALYLDKEKYGEGKWSELHDAKLEALESIVEEAAGAPILVAYHFKSDLARLQRAFPQGRALDAEPGTIQAWNAGQIPLLFAHPASAGHGLNLQDGGNIVVFFGLWWNLEEHAQLIERVGPTRQAQSGHNRPVFVHRIVARGTVDELVVARLKSKASVQDTLIAAMKKGS